MQVLTATSHSLGTLHSTLADEPNHGTKERPASNTASIIIIPPSHPGRQIPT